MRPKLVALALLSLLFSNHLFAQKKKKVEISGRTACVYGDIKPADFAPEFFPIDSSAEAVYLFSGGSAKFSGNVKSFFDVNYTIHERIRLLNKNSFSVLGSVTIPVYTSDPYNEQWISDLQAATYTLEGGQVLTTKLDKKSLFKEKDGEFTKTKFTLPNLKEGCIIEYTFILHIPQPPEPFLPSWKFQGRYPVLWSEYETVVPAFFQFAQFDQGYLPFTIDTLIIGHETYNIISAGHDANSVTTSLVAATNTLDHIWAIKNVPALKPDNFITTMDDYTAKMDFQLATIQYPNRDAIPVKRTWLEVSDELLKDKNFAGEFVNGNHFFDDDIAAVTAGADTYQEKAKRIYNYVRDNYTCTDHDSRWLSQPLRKTYQTKKGNVADINLLLTAMLISQDMEAYPVLLSTTSNGKASELYPAPDKFNYVICELILFNKKYLLDASNNKLGFNHLSPDCYNGYGHVVSSTSSVLIPMFADSLKETATTSVFITNSNLRIMTGSVNLEKGYDESLSIRNEVTKKGKDEFFKTLQKHYPDNYKLDNETIDNLDKLDLPVKISYDIRIENPGDDIIYFSPMPGEGIKTNPFTAAVRYYPVDMPYASDKTYVLNMEIPKGYEVAELPKSAKVKLNDDDGMFEYMIANTDDHIQLRSHVKLKATYRPEDYQTLRDFFSFIIKKEEEQVVFKKIK